MKKNHYLDACQEKAVRTPFNEKILRIKNEEEARAWLENQAAEYILHSYGRIKRESSMAMIYALLMTRVHKMFWLGFL